MQKILLPIAIAVALIVAGLVFRAANRPTPIPNPFPSHSRAHVPFEDFIKTLAAMPELEAHLRKAGKGEDASQIGFQLSQSGLKRLSDADLEQNMALTTKLVEHLDLKTCAALSRNDPDAVRKLSPRILKAIENLSVEEIRGYFDLTTRAVAAELKKVPVPSFSERRSQQAMRTLSRKFSAEELALLVRVTDFPSTASDESACWIVKTVFSEIMTLPSADRQSLARLFAQEKT